MTSEVEETREHRVLPLLLSMISTRVELAAIDAEAHVQSTFVAMMVTLVAVILALIAFAFVGVAIIVLFWDTHRVAATIGVMAAYASVAVGAALLARSAWKSRPSAFAATLHELELDRAALRGRS
jgi:uncharacterized membrane protein YqjE